MSGTTTRPRRGRDLIDHFWSLVEKSETCWVWKACVTQAGGYGRFWNGVEVVRSHRYSWELANGPIPDGMWVLHRCDNPPCVRPDHLLPGTQKENVADDIAIRGKRKGKSGRTHCPQGHEYVAGNIYSPPGTTHRQCRTCRKQYDVKRRAA